MPAEKSISTIRFPARADQLKMVRGHILENLEVLNCTETEADRIVLAVNEACMNVIQHGYGANHTDNDHSEEIIVDISSSGREIIFRITDFANTANPENIMPRALDDIRPGGLGVHFMQEIMDKIEFSKRGIGAGNILELRKTIKSPE